MGSHQKFQEMKHPHSTNSFVFLLRKGEAGPSEGDEAALITRREGGIKGEGREVPQLSRQPINKGAVMSCNLLELQPGT